MLLSLGNDMRIVMCLFLISSGIVLGESSEGMASSCKRVTEGIRDGERVTLRNNFETGNCWGAFGVIEATTTLSLKGETKRLFRICSPKGSTRTQYIAIFMAFLKRNPRKLNEDFWIVALDALREAFPGEPNPTPYVLR